MRIGCLADSLRYTTTVSETVSLKRLASSDDPDELSQLTREYAGELLAGLDDIVPRARSGSPQAIREYVRTWLDLEEWTLAALHACAADFVMQTDDGLLLVDNKGAPSHHLTDVLEQEALHAPFSLWVQALGDSSGIAVHLIAAIRRLTGRGSVKLPSVIVRPMLFAENSDSLDPRRFLRLAHRELESSVDSLDAIADLLSLTDAALSSLFGVSRQRIAQWRADGVPVMHQSKLMTIAQIADLLDRNLKPERIPGVVRTPAAAFQGESILDAIEHDRHLEVLDRVKDSFDWAKTA